MQESKSPTALCLSCYSIILWCLTVLLIQTPGCSMMDIKEHVHVPAYLGDGLIS